MIDFREIYIAELKAVGFSASDAEEIAAWYLGAPGTTPFPAHCRRVALAASGYDPSQPRNADGEWTSGGGARPREPETKPQHDRYGSTDEAKLSTDAKKNAERGTAAIEEVMRKKSGYVDKAMFRPEVGWIRFEWGDAGNPAPDEKGVTYKGGHGLSHIDVKAGHDVRDLPAVIAKGEIYKHENPERLYVLHGEKFAVLRKLGKGHKVAITEFNSSHDPKQIAFIKNQPRAAKPGEVKGR